MPIFRKLERGEFEPLPEKQPINNYRPRVHEDRYVNSRYPIPTPEIAERAAAALGWIQEPPIPTGAKLAELMTERGVTEVHCARMLGLRPQDYDKLEKGRLTAGKYVSHFRTIHIEALARVLRLNRREELGLMHLSGCLTRMDSKIDLTAEAA